MKQINKTISQLRKSLKKVRKSLMFVHDVKVLNSSYDIDYQSKSVQKELASELNNLISQRKKIKSDSEFLVSKIDAEIEALKHFLNLT